MFFRPAFLPYYKSLPDKTGTTESAIKKQQASDQISQIAWLLDNAFRIPGLKWRFGLDSLIGLIPGAGDLVSTAMALLLLIRAFQFRLPGIVVTRMVLNSLIDLVIGSIPLFGDIFDFAWKSNSMNMKLFHQYAQEPQRNTRRHYFFIGFIVLIFVSAFLLVTLGTFLLLRKLF